MHLYEDSLAVIAMAENLSNDDDVFDLFLQKLKIGSKLHIYL